MKARGVALRVGGTLGDPTLPPLLLDTFVHFMSSSKGGTVNRTLQSSYTNTSAGKGDFDLLEGGGVSPNVSGRSCKVLVKSLGLTMVVVEIVEVSEEGGDESGCWGIYREEEGVGS